MEIKGNQSLKDSAAGGQSDQTRTSRKVHWDESNARRFSSDVFMAGFNQGEIALRWGINQKRDGKKEPGQKGDGDPGSTRIRLLSQTIMSPYTAKKLAGALATVIRQYEDRYGVLEIKSSPEGAPDQRQDRTYEKEAQFFHLLKGLDVEMGFERSFKVAKGAFLKNRFLLGVNKEDLGRWADDRLTQTCRLMAMPKSLLHTFRQHLTLGNYVHFGFEQNEKTTLYKVYLEFWETFKKEIGKGMQRPDPVLLHLGLKWDVANPLRQSLTRYTWYPWLSSQEILQRVSQISEAGRGAAGKEAAEQLLSLAQTRIPEQDILYLEVTEEGNPRRSFDINVYRANLQLAEIYPLLSMLCRRHSISFETFHSFYDGIKTKRFGHLAAGIDRAGESFFTVYYGARSTYGDRSRQALPINAGMTTSAEYRMPARKRRVVRVEETDDKAGYLYQLVKDLGVQTGFERSFKFLNSMFLSDRFLMGFMRPASGIGLDDAIMKICNQIGMPEDHQDMFRAELHEANIVLFGFEKSEKARIYKVYLEFGDKLRKAAEQDPVPESVVLHTGFKWDVSDNSRKVVAQYKAFHVLRPEDISARLLRDFYGNPGRNPYRIVDDILDLAGSRTKPDELLYFEASENHNLRRSFDISMYMADLHMTELYPLLVDAARHYSIDLARFDELYGGVKDQKFGHLSGGMDREGRDFLTVYFSQKGSTRRRIKEG